METEGEQGATFQIKEVPKYEEEQPELTGSLKDAVGPEIPKQLEVFEVV